MPASESLTPLPAGPDHPAHNLRIGEPEDVQTLLKLTPVKLPNIATVESLIENYPKDKRWSTFRSDPRYIYVMNWMYQCRGYIKLALEHFDVDLFEIELFELVHPPPIDELALLVNKTKLALLGKIHGKKVASLASFEPLFRIYFGHETPLGGGSEDEDTEVDQTAYPKFDDLYIDEKIDIFYVMMTEVSQYPDFRDFIDKNKFAPDQLRTPMIYSHSVKKNGHGEDYVLAFDGTALYKRLVAVPELNVPKKRKLAPQWPEEEYGPEKFDAASVEFELIFKDIYGLNEFIKSLLHNKKSKKNKAMLDVLQLPAFISNAFSYDIKKRKILSHRRKDLEMARLLATRKRSSRLEAKEKQRHIEEQERKLKEMEELQYAASRRRSQRARLQMQTKMKMDYTAGLTREERLNLRMQKAVEDSVNASLASTPALSDIERRETSGDVAEVKIADIDGIENRDSENVAEPATEIEIRESLLAPVVEYEQKLELSKPATFQQHPLLDPLPVNQELPMEISTIGSAPAEFELVVVTQTIPAAQSVTPTTPVVSTSISPSTYPDHISGSSSSLQRSQTFQEPTQEHH